MNEFKFPCPRCARHIQCDTSYCGSEINCPACQQAILVPQAPGSGTPAAQPPVPAQARTGKNVLVIAASVVVLAALVTAGWFGYSKYKRGNLPPGLVALWSGNGNAKDSFGNNNGMLRGNMNFASGKVGQAFVFDGGSAYVEVPSSAKITPTGSFTVMTWVNYSRTSGGPPSVPIVGKGQDVNGPLDWFLGISPDRRLRPHVNTDDGNWVYFDCATPLDFGKWYHVAMVYDGASLRGYVNGMLDGTHAVSGTVQATDYSLRIGVYAPINATGGDKLSLPGEIDEVSLYNRALTAKEVKAVWSNEK